MKVFVWAPEQFENLCVLARTLEVFGFTEVHIYDPHKIVRERYGKAYYRRLRLVSAGAFFKLQWHRFETDPLEFLTAHVGRRIATVPRQSATSLHQFHFHETDLLILGSEGDGLPDAILDVCDHQITVPQYGMTESLNLSVAAGIVLAEWKRQEAAAATAS